MGKPLISDAEMRGMYSTMLRLRAAKREPAVLAGLSRAERAGVVAQPESLLAALVFQLRSSDTLVTHGNDPLPKVALSHLALDREQVNSTGTAAECAALATGMAMRKRNSASHKGLLPITVALLADYPSLAADLPLIARHHLALLIIVQSPADTRAATEARNRATTVPVLPVDDSDAVAVCRVLQESLLRARQGLGGTVLHAVRMQPAPDAVAGMEERLRRRGLLPSA